MIINDDFICTADDIEVGIKTPREQSISNMVYQLAVIEGHCDPNRDNDAQYIKIREKAIKTMISLLLNFE